MFYPELEASAAAPVLNRTRVSNPAPTTTMGTTFPLLAVVVIVVIGVVVVIGISINIFLIMTYLKKL